MSDEKVEIRKKRPTNMSTHTTVINRISGGGLGAGRASMGGGFRSSMGMMGVPPASYHIGAAKQMSTTGVNIVMDARAKEKTAIQELNKRLGKHIENSKFLEAQNKALAFELEEERKKKIYDGSSIKELYQQELDECRKVIGDLENEKAVLAPKIATLEDVVETEKERNMTLESELQNLRKQIDRLNNQVGELEGENGGQRRAIESAEDEIKRLRMDIDDHKMKLEDARNNLEDECKLRIEAECARNLSIDEHEFMISLLEKEIEELKKLMNNDVGQLDIKNMWKGEITSCIKSLQEDNERELAKIKADYQARYELQAQQLASNNMRDNASMAKLESEITRLKNKHSDQGPMIAELTAKLNNALAEKDKLREELDEIMDRLEMEKAEHMKDVHGLQDELHILMEKFRDLQDAKLTLETEISTYRRLLEGEEDSMNSLMTNVSGARSKGADKLNDLVQNSSSGSFYSQSSSSGGFRSGGGGGFRSGEGFRSGDGFRSEGYSDGMVVGDDSTAMSGQSQTKMGDAKVLIRKKSSGPLCIDEAQGGGAFVTLAYTTKDKKTTPINLIGWKVCRTMQEDKNPCCTYEFTSDCVMHPGGKIKIFGSNYAKDANKGKGDLVANFGSWKSGGGTFSLIDANKADKSSLIIEFS
ncbi:retrograde protein of 51 kDa-like isoform X2 [Ylistrum balloti]|uniref:retrograde protein of 51 kDa-like isoform X2 n=1 Tax=Ylistrum balloti TaxID=509963 RepID=UPI002905B3F1|nr:retrograde protein of 51 kDa-like isoform X2 [Ylistrum balloti]